MTSSSRCDISKNDFISDYDMASFRCLRPWLGCSKLTTSLVNLSLNFQKLISQICQYFLLKKCEKLLHCKSFFIFSTKNFSVFGYKVVKHLTS